LPPGLDPLVGTFDRVGAVALNAVLASDARLGESVAVFGQGVIGLLATQLLTSMGCQVVAVDSMPLRRSLAESWGALALDPGADDVALAVRAILPDGVDRVIELSGAYPALQQAVRVAGPDGTVIAAGFYQGSAVALALGEEFHHNRVSIVSSQIGGLPPALQRRWTRDRLHQTVMQLFASGRLNPLPLVTHVIPAQAAARAYALIESPPPELLQVVLDFGQDAP
jgi:threonine dehydrogenase-like Zn-dependent dehydrogenase